MRRLEDALFQMTDPSRADEGARNALMALGAFIGWLASAPKAREDLKQPPVLSSAWITAADDGSPEFRVAAALAALGLPYSTDGGNLPTRKHDDTTDDTKQPPETPRAPPMAVHFAPIDEASFFDVRRFSQPRRWPNSDTARNVVWGTGSLISNMIAVLERRLVEATARGLDDKPLAAATHARLADVAEFLAENFDDGRCATLLAGLVWTRPRPFCMSATTPSTPVPFAYSVLKPIFTPDPTLRRTGALTEAARLPIPPGLVARLRTAGPGLGDHATDIAVRTALARARGSGIPSPFDPARAGGRRGKGQGGRLGVGVQAERLAAALLIPIDYQSLKTLMSRAYPGAIPQHDPQSTEDRTDAA